MRTLWKAIAISSLALIGCSQPTAEQTADLIFVNGSIYTVDNNRGWATAVAIGKGTILHVGTDDSIDEFKGPDTEIVDLGGKMLMPAFQDVHIHPISSGKELLTVSLTDLGSIEAYVQAVRQYADENPDEPWILGGGWSMDAFGPGAKASKRLLDEVVSDRPVYLTSADGHSGWANTRALEIAGIDTDTRDPATGIIDRDPETGEAIGSLQEGAMDLLTAHIPPASKAFNEQGLQVSVDLLNSYGITAITDASVNQADLDIYRALDQRGDLTLRVVASIWWEPGTDIDQVEHYKSLRQEYTTGNVNAGTIKIMQDGVLENFTGAMSEPYFVEGFPTGIPMNDPELLKRAVTALDAEGFQVHFHAIGDAAITQCLDAVEAAIRANGDNQLRHHISHLQLIRPEDLPRFRELGVVANFQPLWAYADSYITDLTIPFIGDERAQWLYTIRSVVNSGGKIAFGSDWSVSTANPFPQIETAVTRTDAEGNDAPFMPEETIDLATALAAFTINAAYVNGIDNKSGSIEPGKVADLIVLDRNLFDIPVKEISETKVLLTLFGGTPVHGTLDSARH